MDMKICLIGIIFLCVIAATCCAEERWALLVGIDQYAGESITPLKGAVSDALALRDMLTEYARFSADNIFCLTSDDRANLPNLGNIITKLEYIASKANEGDLFLFFFAGHGISWEGQNYLLAYESDIRSPLLLSKTGLSVEELNEYLAKIQSANMLLILDACRNSPQAGRGDDNNMLTVDFVRSVGVSLKDDRTSDIQFCATIYACKPGQRAFEWPGKERGFFSIALEEALSGKADKDVDGKVTLNEAESYLSRRVPDLVRRELGDSKEQTPWIVRSGAGTGDMVLSWITEEQQVAMTPVSSSESTGSKSLGNEANHQTSQMDKIQPKDPELFEELEWEPIGDEAGKEEAGKEEIFEELDWVPIGSDTMALTQQQEAEGWVSATGEYRGSEIVLEEARRNALDQARQIAVQIALKEEIDVLGSLMRSSTIQDFQQSLTTLSQFDLFGKIVEEEKPVWSPVEDVQFHPGRPPVLVCRVELQAKVAKKKSQPDSGFSVSLRPNNRVFKDGEEMILCITSTQDCYITVFSLLANGTVLVLDPPLGQYPRSVPGGQSLSLPTEEEKQLGKCFRLSLSGGETEVIESVLVIATKDNVPLLIEDVERLNSGRILPGGKERLCIMPDYQSALEEITRWLVSIPLERRTFDIQEYKIIEN